MLKFLNLRTFWTSLTVVALITLPVVLNAQVSVTGTTYTQSFNIGTSATASLPAGFKFGNATTDFNNAANTIATTQAYGTSGTGVVTGTSAGGAINWANGVTSSSTDRSVGFLTTNSFTSPRDIFFAFTNNTGSIITSIDLSFAYEKYRSGTRAFDWTFFHGATATNVNTAETAGDHSSPADANNTTIFNPPTSFAKSVTISGLSIADGSTYYFRWRFTGVGGSSNCQGFGLDDLSMTLTTAAATPPTITNTTTTLNGTYGTTLSPAYTVTATGTAPITFSESGLPAGLSLNATTGVISGSPLVVGSTNFTVTATNSGGTDSKTLTLVSLPKDVTISGIGIDNKIFDGTTSATINGTASLVGVLPADASNVSLGGTPVATFATSGPGVAIPVTVSGYALSGSAAGNYNLLQPSGLSADIYSGPAPVINSANTANGIYGTTFTPYTITASNAPTSFSAVNLPAGLSVNTSTGEITGTPTVVGTFTSTISATNSNGTGNASLVFTIAPKELTVSSAVADNKVYDGTTAATISGSVLNGIVGSDVVTITNTGTFASANVGTGIAVTSTQVLGGADANKYTVTLPTGLSADITPAPQSITFSLSSPQLLPIGGTLTLNGTATSGLPVSYSSSDPSVATVSGNVLTVVSYGLTTITASQAGNGNYDPASDVSVSLQIDPPPVTYNFGTTTPNPLPTSGSVANLTFGAFSSGNNVNTSNPNPNINTTSASTTSLGFSGQMNLSISAQIGALNQSVSAYHEVTITPSAGFQPQVSGISFASRSTASGPQQITLFSNIDNYTTPIHTFTANNNGAWASFSTALPNLSNNAQPLTFRIYGSNGTASSPLTSTSANNWRIDDVKITASAIPFTCVAPTLSLSTTDPSCINANDGSISLSTSGGTAPFTYSWSNGATTQNINNLAAGTYTVTVTASGGCTTTETASIASTVACLTIDSVDVNPGCHQTNSKSIEIFASGGSGTYTYSYAPIVPGATEFTPGYFIDLSAGTYTVSVNDGTTTATSVVTIIDPTPISTNTFVIAQPTCPLGNNGKLAASSTGGIPDPTIGYSFFWYNDSTFAPASLFGSGDTLSGIAAGVYHLIVEDSKGCMDTAMNVVLTDPPAIVGSSTVTACDSFQFNGNTLTVSNTYTATFTAINGCDSTHTLVLTINNATSSSITHSACVSYTFLGNTYTSSGVYTVKIPNAAGCDSNITLTLTILNTVTTNTNVSAPFTYTLPWGTVVNTSGTYSNTYTSASGCDSISNVTVNITGVLLNINVRLSGPLSGVSSTLMNDGLRTASYIPSIEPYGSLNTTNNPYMATYTHVGGGGGEVASAAVFGVSGNDAIVDWVFVELRSASAPGTVVHTRSALLQRDGDVVDVDGASALEFPTAASGNYYVSVRHRNHIGAMTANTVALNATTAANVDFTSTSTPLYLKPTSNNPSPLTGAMRVLAGGRALYAGNANITDQSRARIITYNSTTASDRHALQVACPGTTTINGYSVFDCDMNGFARFSGLVPDRLVILSNCANSTTIIVHEQLP